MAKDSRLTKRQLKKLVKEQTGIVKKDPNNLVSRLKLAGALKELGKDKEAVGHYREVAQTYASTGKLVQAISVYKGILEITPGHERTEEALSELSAKRAKDIKAKSMPRLQQQDDGRWVMPSESDVSEEEGTDPGAPQGKLLASSPSVLRLPAPMPTDSAPSRRRRGRRSRPRLDADGLPDETGTASSPSFDSVDLEPALVGAGVPSQPEGFNPSLPNLADHESAAAPPEPLPPDPLVEMRTLPPVHEPPAHVMLPRDLAPAAVPPPPPAPMLPPDTLADDGGETAERDLSTVAAKMVEAERDASDDVVVTPEQPSAAELNKSDFPAENVEEPTSPGPSGYTDTIRKSAARIDMDALVSKNKSRGSDAPTPMRRTLVGVPAPETPDLPKTQMTTVPPPDTQPTGEFVSPLPAVTRASQPLGTPAPVVPPVDNKRTVQMEREPDMATPVAATGEPTQEPQLPDELADETLGSIFDDDEEAFWAELESSEDADKDQDAHAPEKPATVSAPASARPRRESGSKHKSTLVSTPMPAPQPKGKPSSAPAATPTPGTPRAGKAKVARKSSKMTIPMGAAAFKKAVEERESRPEASADKKPGAGAPQSRGEVQLEEIALFRDLSETSREMLQSRLVRRAEKKGTDIVREGDPGNALFVVSAGQVHVTKLDRQGHKVSLATLGPGAFFGEFALLSDRKRHATVTVAEEGVFFEISRKVIADLTKSDPSFGNTLRQFYRRRLLGTLVRSAPFFDPLSKKEREALMGRLRFRRIPENSKIITEGEPGGGFFLILIGEVKVTKTQPDGTEKVLSRLTDGSYFGEMSLLKGGNAVAAVTTVTPTEIVQLAAAEFYRILSKYPQIWEEVNREAKRRELANLQILSGRTPDPKPSDDSVVM